MMRLLFLVLICVISCGCRDTDQGADEQPRALSQRAAVKLTVLVVEDAELAQGIRLLAGEWNERSGGDLTVVEKSLAEMLAAEHLSADVVVYPSRQLGELVMRDWLRPMRPSVLADESLAWSDVLTALSDQSVRYGGEVYALPLGEMPLAMGWTGELPEKLPTTWEQFAEAGFGVGPETESAWPLTREFLARALALTTPADRATLFFNAQTLEARLTTPQLVQAGEWLAATAKPSPQRAAAVVLPRAKGELRLSPLLAAEEVYTASMDRWEKSAGIGPVVLGFGGRLVSVTESSRNAASAFKLIGWLASGTVGTDLSRRSPATLWYRASQVPNADKWFAEDADDDRVRWLTDQLSRGDAYLIPRIRGIDSYWQELEAALEQVVGGELEPKQALAATEEAWNKLTDSLGREQQRTAFNRHLGLSE